MDDDISIRTECALKHKDFERDIETVEQGVGNMSVALSKLDAELEDHKRDCDNRLSDVYAHMDKKFDKVYDGMNKISSTLNRFIGAVLVVPMISGGAWIIVNAIKSGQ